MAVSDGVATFSPLTLTKAANGYTIEATSTGLTTVTTQPFDVVPAAASKLAITTEPPRSVTAGQAFVMAVTVEDKYGNAETGYTGSVTVLILANPGRATLGERRTVAVSNGVAIFSTLTINKPDDGYTIMATDAGLAAATSSAFNVTTPAGGQDERQRAHADRDHRRTLQLEPGNGGIDVHRDDRAGEQPG